MNYTRVITDECITIYVFKLTKSTRLNNTKLIQVPNGYLKKKSYMVDTVQSVIIEIEYMNYLPTIIEKLKY